ncbi:hypothetical protein [Methylomicrobium agile]|uniref:hypothetical protein n=1 Tax=Methylomicrobium agile TaxID=39774 RepID=UPI0004DF5D1C|nr:hypothetical protein [Methylomicrobium agile]
MKNQEDSQVKLQKSSEPNTVVDLPPPDIDYGIITSGLCPTPEDQAFFDKDVAGQPPSAD